MDKQSETPHPHVNHRRSMSSPTQREYSSSYEALPDHATHRRSSSFPTPWRSSESQGIDQRKRIERADQTRNFPEHWSKRLARSDHFTLATDEIDRDRLCSVLRDDTMRFEAFQKQWKKVVESRRNETFRDTSSASALTKAEIDLDYTKLIYENISQKVKDASSPSALTKAEIDLDYTKLIYENISQKVKDASSPSALTKAQQELENAKSVHDEAECNYYDAYDSWDMAQANLDHTGQESQNAYARWGDAQSKYQNIEQRYKDTLQEKYQALQELQSYENEDQKDSCRHTLKSISRKLKSISIIKQHLLRNLNHAESESHKALAAWRELFERENPNHQILCDKTQVAKTDLEHAALNLGRALQRAERGAQEDTQYLEANIKQHRFVYESLLQTRNVREISTEPPIEEKWLKLGKKGPSTDKDITEMYWHDVRWTMRNVFLASKLSDNKIQNIGKTMIESISQQLADLKNIYDKAKNATK